MAEKITMGYWDCPFCDSKGIPGTTYDCPNCGRQRGKETKFYMKEGGVQYIQGHKVVGADWYCEYCGALNTAERDTCENCGSSKTESKDDYFSINQKEEEKKKQEQIQAEQANQSSSGSSLLMKLIIAGVAVFALIFIISLVKKAAAPKGCTFDVQEMTWENTIEIEEYKTFRESDWEMPPDARLDHTAEEVKTYESVLDHYELVEKTRTVQSGGHYENSYTDNGDGTFTEHSTFVPDYTTETYTEEAPVYVKVPVKATKYYYDIDRWAPGRTETTTGKDKDPYWRDTVLSDKEREKGRSSKYTMSGILHYESFGKEKEKPLSMEISEDWWEDIETGQTLEVTLKGDKIVSWKLY